MPNENSAESIARAAKLRAQIDRMTKPSAEVSGNSTSSSSERPMSPREFIQREMDRLDRKE
jgi:hypothetical protein